MVLPEEEAVPEVPDDESHGFGDAVVVVVVQDEQDAYEQSAFDVHLEAAHVEPVDLELDVEAVVQDAADYWPASRLSSDGAGGGLVDLEAKFDDQNRQNDVAAAVVAAVAVVFDIELHDVEVVEAVNHYEQH